MENRNEIVRNLFEKHIKNTAKDAVVENITIFLCYLTFAVSKGNNFQPNIYLNTRVLKHIYDKKPAEEFDCIILYLRNIIRKPDRIYKNKNPNQNNWDFYLEAASYKMVCLRLKSRMLRGNTTAPYKLLLRTPTIRISNIHTLSRVGIHKAN